MQAGLFQGQKLRGYAGAWSLGTQCACLGLREAGPGCILQLLPRIQPWADFPLLNLPPCPPPHATPACCSSGFYSIMGPRTIPAPDCLRGLGNCERKPFKSAFLENAKPAKLGQTSPWVSLCGDSEISRRERKI